jgi:hypothetical protein
MNMEQKLQLFFIDFSLMPLLMFENYLSGFNYAIGSKNTPDFKDIDRMATCAEFMSLAENLQIDCLESQQWGLLADIGRISVIIPA